MPKGGSEALRNPLSRRRSLLRIGVFWFALARASGTLPLGEIFDTLAKTFFPYPGVYTPHTITDGRRSELAQNRRNAGPGNRFSHKYGEPSFGGSFLGSKLSGSERARKWENTFAGFGRFLEVAFASRTG